LFTEPLLTNRSLHLRPGPNRKHFYCIVDRPCMLGNALIKSFKILIYFCEGNCIIDRPTNLLHRARNRFLYLSYHKTFQIKVVDVNYQLTYHNYILISCDNIGL
jgi:hypothetical protein